MEFRYLEFHLQSIARAFLISHYVSFASSICLKHHCSGILSYRGIDYKLPAGDPLVRIFSPLTIGIYAAYYTNSFSKFQAEPFTKLVDPVCPDFF